MKYYLSTISDVIYSWDEENCKETISYNHVTGPIAKEYGFGLELAEYCIATNCDSPEDVRSFFMENAKNYSGDIIVHAPFNELFPHAIDPAVVRVAKERYKAIYKLCEEIGAKKMIVHANYIKALYFPSWFKERQIEFWKEFLEENKGDCIIVVENVMEPDPNLITDIIKNVNNPRLRMCLDVGHANLHRGKSVYEWIEECSPYLSHLHIHNNNGPADPNATFEGMADLHKALGNGIIDYERILKLAESFGIDGLSATIETNEARESAEWLRNKGFI